MSVEGDIDWAFGEIIAFGALLHDGITVRLAGQDSRRGTFVQRHSVLVDSSDGAEYFPLSTLADDTRGRFFVHDSLLSEYAAMGFEYGYSVENTEALVAWEAQFGDFANGAQSVVDEFISSGEVKWGQQSAVTLLLPAMPLLAVRLGKIPMPILPQSAEDLLRDEPQPRREQVYQATARADEVLTGMIFGAFAVTVSCLVVLTMAGTVSTLLLAGAVSVAGLLRARLVPTVRHRLPLLTSGLIGVALLPLVGASGASALIRVVAMLPVMLVAAALAATAGLLYSRRAPSPRLARLGDALDVVLQLAIVPIACSVLGLYAFMRALNG